MGDIAVAVLERLRNMIWIPGGAFRMGSDKHYPEGAQAHRVTVGNFWINRTPVTNWQFRNCINEAGYVTSGCEGLSWRAAADPESRLKLPALVNQTPWQEICRQHVGQLATGADFEMALKYQHVAERYGTPRDNH